MDLRKTKKSNPHAALETKVVCAICAHLEPLATAHDHHRTPRAFGGTDDESNRLWLCASCHTRLHRVQEFLVQGKQSAAYDLTRSIFPTQSAARGELWALANEAAKAEQETREVFGSHQTTMKVTLSVDAEVWATLKIAARERGTTVRVLATQLLEKAARSL